MECCSCCVSTPMESQVKCDQKHVEQPSSEATVLAVGVQHRRRCLVSLHLRLKDIWFARCLVKSHLPQPVVALTLQERQSNLV
eukprot:734446-Amphidinium_carterae.2